MHRSERYIKVSHPGIRALAESKGLDLERIDRKMLDRLRKELDKLETQKFGKTRTSIEARGASGSARKSTKIGGTN